MPEFDINDPSTWSDDVEELEKMATEGVEPEAKAEEETPTEEPGDSPVSEKKEEEPAKEPEEEEELPIATKKGDKTMPYSVLANERAQNKRLRAELEELRSKLEVEPSPEPEAKAEEPSDELPASVAMKVAKMREDWGDDIADQFLETYQMKQTLKEQLAELDAIKTAMSQREDNDRRTEQEQIQDAIDNSPKMAEWVADEENPVWYERALELNATLVRVDPAYAKMSWEERFAVLPGKVEGLFGVAQAPVEKEVDTAALKEEAARRVAEAEEKTVPTSMSDLPGGDDVKHSEIAKLESLTPRQIQAHLDSLADDPEKLAAYLSSVA